MRTLQILRRKPPRSCGRVSSTAYYEWKCYHNQLWLFPEHQVKAEDCPPAASWNIAQVRRDANKHTFVEGPRKGDLIHDKNGEFIGVVTWVDNRGSEVGYVNPSKKPVSYRSMDRGRFNSHEPSRGRTRWNV
jgi:hypothetical protein